MLLGKQEIGIGSKFAAKVSVALPDIYRILVVIAIGIDIAGVGIRKRHIAVPVLIPAFQGHAVCPGIARYKKVIQDILIAAFRGCPAVIGPCCSLAIGILQLWPVSLVVPVVVDGIIYGNAAGSAFFSSNEHDSILALRTIQGRCTGALQ